MITLFSVGTRIDNHGSAVVTVAGEVDVATAPRLRSACLEALEGGATELIVDMSRVGFLDAAGLGALVGVLKRARAAGGSVTLAALHPRVRWLFELTDLAERFAICETLADTGKATA
jgi:anti-sigma B factor antagonist